MQDMLNKAKQASKQLGVV